jgi:predicted phosphoadenosine phosphosulfate sulfurtransferase
LQKEYLPIDVYEALQNRLELLFREFDNIYVSFSGGKDSGLLLNLLLDYRRAHYPDRTVGVFHQDFEAQYTVTTEFITRTFERIKDEVRSSQQNTKLVDIKTDPKE